MSSGPVLGDPIVGRVVSEDEINRACASRTHHGGVNSTGSWYFRGKETPVGPANFPAKRYGWELLAGAWKEKPWHARLVGTFLTSLAKFVTGVQVRWVDCQPDTCQRVYFANHTSHLDPVVLWAVLPPAIRALTRPVAAKDYWTAGVIRRYLAKTVFNAILIDRMEVRAHRNPVDVMLQELGDTHSLIVFPEGGRTPGPDVAPFKSGLYYLCRRRPELELVPVYISNMNRILPRGEILPVPLLACVTFGPPMWLEAGEPKAAFLERARQAVERLRDI